MIIIAHLPYLHLHHQYPVQVMSKCVRSHQLIFFILFYVVLMFLLWLYIYPYTL